MFRRLPRRTFLATTASAAAVLHAVPPPPQPKLSIYPVEEPDILLEQTPSKLEKKIGVARRAVTGVYGDLNSRVQGIITKWIGVESAFEQRVKSIIGREPLTPAILYVGVSTLTGSIITRNRSPFSRFLLPPTLFFVSLNHFLPQTSANLSNYLGSLEDEYLPTVARIHDVSNAHTAMTWEMIKSKTQDGTERVSEGVEVVVGKVQDLTGLKLREALGWSQDRVKVAERAVEKNAGVVEDIK